MCKTIWKMDETSYNEMMDDVKGELNKDECYGSMHIGSVAADIVSDSYNKDIFVDIYVKGYDGAGFDFKTETPHGRAENCIKPLDFNPTSFEEFRDIVEREVLKIVTKGDLSMSEPLSEGYTSDPDKLLAGANGTWD